MKPHFKPGESNKAYYTDTNYQLLGKLIEVISGMCYAEALAHFIIRPLGLQKTYLYTDITDKKPIPLYYKSMPLYIPKAMTSFGPDGGIVSTAEETMVFIKAFFEGRFFPKENLAQMASWKRIFFPLEYGVGMMRFKLPRIFSPFRPIPEIIGHSGLSGAFAYYCPEKNLYLTGTVNQVYNPSSSYRLIVKVLNSI
jgi:CubicO group peptidase (beta-lactamase class C family)